MPSSATHVVFAGDTVLDPFLGTGTTSVAAARWGRNSIGIEVNPDYHDFARKRLSESTSSLFGCATVHTEDLRRFP